MILLFDFDGVIANTWSRVKELLIRQVNTHTDLEIDEQGLKALFSKNIYEWLAEKGATPKAIKAIQNESKEALPNLLIDAPLFEGIREVLGLPHKKFIITSNFASFVKSYVNKHELDVFEDILGTEHGKSKVDKISKVKEQYPQEFFVFIGDTTGDIIEAKEAKVETIATTWGFHSAEDLLRENPDYLANSPKKLAEIIEKIRQKNTDF